MKTLAMVLGALGISLALVTPGTDRPAPRPALAPDVPDDELTAVVQRTCQVCHNDQLLTGNMSLEGFDVAAPEEHPETTEKMIVKLRAEMMPPPGMPRPAGDTLLALVERLEEKMDRAAAASGPGGRTFQRLNRAEYQRSIRDLLALEVDAGDWLPLDTKSANFDNIADVQMLSPTLLDAYLRAADEISRLAVGNTRATARQVTYKHSNRYSQRERVEGAPRGTRGGASVVHNFPADGEYVVTATLQYESTGRIFGNGRGALHTAEEPEKIEISVNGERVQLIEVGRWAHRSDPETIQLRSDPVFVRAGPQRVTAAFLTRIEGPVEDILSPHGWSLADKRIGSSHGITSLPHLQDLVIGGPYRVTGVSETPSRQAIFTCRPTSQDERLPCARTILSRLASRAYRRPVSDGELDGIIDVYRVGVEEGGFESGIQAGLQAILSSPQFVFRVEEQPADLDGSGLYRLSDPDLASRLSYFLWGAPPDQELVELARRDELAEPGVLEGQARRMLDDPRSEALATRFAAQWLRLQDLDKVHPEPTRYPDFSQQLAEDMRRETELFFHSIVREDRSVLDLFMADYTFLNERLADHYGIPGVTGDRFRRVEYPKDRRRGIFGHGSILTSTSHATRTSPVLRGKWVMEVLLGTPPPPPPPGVPDLEETEGAEGGRFLTTRERMERHRSNPVCASCHQYIDPIGLSLDNFDVTGRWRIKENGMPLDTRGEMYDGTPVESPADLQEALLRRPIPLIRTFTENLMAYALGRRIEYTDKPLVRAMAEKARADDYRVSSFIMAVVKSDAFQMKRAQIARAGEQGPDPK